MTTKTQPKSTRQAKQKATKRARLNPHQKVYFKTLSIYFKKLGLKANDANRHEITLEALSYNKSSKQWTETEWDIVLGFIRHRINGGSGAWTPNHRVAIEIDGARRRLLWRIRKEIPEKYLKAISQDKFKTNDYSTLTLPQLEQLRITAIERARQAKRQKRNLHK